MSSGPAEAVDRFLVAAFRRLRIWKSGSVARTVYTDDQRLWPVYHFRPPNPRAADGVPVVFFHGFGNDGTTWLPFFEVLGARRELVAPDLPGFGRHELRNDEDPTPTWFREVTARFLRELTVRWGQPPIVVGKSMGGLIAGLVAGDVPDLVRALVLIDPGGIDTRPPSPFWSAWERGINYLLPTDRSGWRDMVSILYHQPVTVPPFIQREALRRIQAHRGMYERIFVRLLAEGFNPLGESLERITCPVTVVWGREDRVMDPAGAEVIRRALPNAKIEILEQCGHSPTRERPDEVRRILLEVLSRWG